MANRRKFLAGLGALASGSAAAMGTGAFTSVEAERDVTVNVADDADAFLSLSVISDSANSREYADGSGDTISLDFTSTDSGGSGFNSEATTTIDNIFQIRNQGTQTIYFSISIPEEEFVGNNEFDNTKLYFYSGTNSGTPLNGSNKLELTPGESVNIGLYADSAGVPSFNSSETLSATVSATDEPPENLENVAAQGRAPMGTVLNSDTEDLYNSESPIRDALNEVSQGETLRVGPGTYSITESLRVNNSNVTLLGDDATIEVTAEGSYSDSTTAVAVDADGFSISGFQFVDFLPVDGANAIVVSDAEDLEVTDNTFEATLDEEDYQPNSNGTTWASTAVLPYNVTGSVKINRNNFDVGGPTVYAVYNAGESAASVDATNNWWGADDGPSGKGDGSGSQITSGDNSSRVEYEPFAESPF